MEGLEEAIHIIQGLWSQPGFTFIGTQYQTDRADLEPKPADRIPIWLGVFGERGLALAGRLADGWIPSLEMAPPDKAATMRRHLLAAAREAGRDPDEIRCVYNLEFRVGESGGLPSSIVSGSVDEVASRLLDFVKLGFTGFNFIPADPDDDEQLDLLANRVIPAVRDAA
jgi:alkanesulfonate monooxygenase SsuD/methylene tetrahydromethanopterin reductase-like flavin-dependent oxidoreductase (luciferase family)